VIGEQEATDGVVGLKDLRAASDQVDQRLHPEALLQLLQVAPPRP
jgi:hypothetical protein